VGVWESAFVAFNVLFFGVFDPSILRGHNFLNFNPLLTTFNALDVPIGGVQLLFKC
jgi:hypothetical protein